MKIKFEELFILLRAEDKKGQRTIDSKVEPTQNFVRLEEKLCEECTAEQIYKIAKLGLRSTNIKKLAKAIIATLSKLPQGSVKTITCDRGSEFAGWRQIENELHCDMYFADPYCAWQKGTNENLNGLLREFYPKGRNLSRVSPKTLEKNLALLNARPKKVLGFKKPVDLFNFFLAKCCT